jgi:hypothetical protein
MKTDNIKGIQKQEIKKNSSFSDDQIIITERETLMRMSAHKLENIV